MLVYHNDLKESLALARQHSMDLVNQGLDEFYSFENRLEYLRNGGNFNSDSAPDYMRCHLYSDFVIHSFGWTWYRKVDMGGVTPNECLGRLHPELIGYHAFMHGGLIYHRDYNDRNKGTWSVHT